MSLESFFGLEEGESTGSAEASEKFREQMRKNSKAIKAMTGHQKKRKQKEDKLARILVRFLQDDSKSDAVFLVIKLLQQNVPGPFILAMLMLADPALEEELKAALREDKKPALEGGASAPEQARTASLQTFSNEAALPEAIRQELNAWGDVILEAGLNMPAKTLESVLTPDQKLKSIVLDLLHYSLEQFFQRHALEVSPERVRQFALLSIQSVLIQLRELSLEKCDMDIVETPLEPDTEQA